MIQYGVTILDSLARGDFWNQQFINSRPLAGSFSLYFHAIKKLPRKNQWSYPFPIESHVFRVGTNHCDSIWKQYLGWFSRGSFFYRRFIIASQNGGYFTLPFTISLSDKLLTSSFHQNAAKVQQVWWQADYRAFRVFLGFIYSGEVWKMGNLGKIAYFGDIDHFHASYHYWVTNWDRRLSEVSYES